MVGFFLLKSHYLSLVSLYSFSVVLTILTKTILFEEGDIDGKTG